MDMLEWAKKEIELACKNDLECGYFKACCNSALKAFETLLDDGHSGMSIGITKQILNKFIDGVPLFPITEDDPEEIWEEYGKDYNIYEDGTYSQQCSRKTSLFRYTHPDGSITYNDVDRVVCYPLEEDDFGPFTNGFFSKIVEEKYPLTLPYVSERYKLYIESSYGPLVGKAIKLRDGKYKTIQEPKYDLMWLKYMIKPDGSREEINRYFIDYDYKIPRQEITKEEYDKYKI